VLDSTGHVVKTISGPKINGPWDMTAVADDQNATLFVTNVLNGTVASGETPTNQGTVVRIRLHTDGHRPPTLTATDVIASGFPERTDAAALVIGPTGVALGDEGILYVADTLGNRIAAIPNAMNRQVPFGGGGTTVAVGGPLNNPLGLTMAPNDDVLTANANDGNIVETRPSGSEFPPVDTGAGAGGLFGLTVAPNRKGVYFVDDTNNTLGLLH
jgi:sugar lactone lactonase YvrE